MISMLFCRSAETVPECASEEKEATENNQKSHPKSHSPSSSSSSSSSTQKKNDCDIKTEEVKANLVPPGVTASLCSSPSDDTNPASTLSSSAQASSEEASSTSISSSAKEKERFLIQYLLQKFNYLIGILQPQMQVTETVEEDERRKAQLRESQVALSRKLEELRIQSRSTAREGLMLRHQVS